MKKILLIALLLAAFAPIFAFEYTYEGNTLEYTILSDNTVSVKHGSKAPQGKLVIPEIVSDGNQDYMVVVVDSNAFNAKTSISSIVLPSTIKHIRYQAFRDLNQENLTITLNEGLETIGDRAFCKSTGFRGTMLLPASLDTIDDYAFFHCTGITTFEFQSGKVCHLKGSNHFNETLAFTCLDNIYYLAISNSEAAIIRVINKEQFFGKLEIAETVTINDRVLNVTVIHDNTFSYLQNITELILSKNIKLIGYQSFRNNTSMSKITLNEGLATIGNRAFCQCTAIVGNVIIPSSVKIIEDYAFYNCTGVENVYVKSLTPPTLNGSTHFEGQNADYNLLVHCDAYDVYVNDAKWSKISSRIKDACLTIYHNGTPKPGNGVCEATVGLVASITYKRTFTAGTWETLYLPFPVEKVTIEDDEEPNGYWSPKPWDIVDGGDYYLATPASTTAANGELIFDMTTDLKEGTPYIIQFPGQYAEYYNGREVTFHGPSDWYELGNTSFAPVTPTSQMKMAGNTTLQKQTISDEVYVLRATNDFMLQHSATTLYPFECYVMPQQTNGVARAPKMTVRLRGKNDVTTSISSANAANPINYLIDGNSLTVYANGQSVQIYSINGILLHSISVGEDMAQVLLDKGCYIIYSNGNSQKVIL